MPSDLKDRIEKLIKELKSGYYDNEACHWEYDDLLKDFILNYDKSLLLLMKELIEIEKDFWYA